MKHLVRSGINRIALKLGLITLAMFGFGYALVPIYDLICDLTGINGKVDIVVNQYDPSEQTIDTSRTIAMRFISIQNEQTQIVLEAKPRTMQVHPGQVYQVDYKITNPTDRPLTIQAIPSVSPSNGADNLKKIQCFCFNNLQIEANQTIDTSVVFYLENKVESIPSLTLSYTLFDITQHTQNL